jgi:hypothetical protein
MAGDHSQPLILLPVKPIITRLSKICLYEITATSVDIVLLWLNLPSLSFLLLKRIKGMSIPAWVPLIKDLAASWEGPARTIHFDTQWISDIMGEKGFGEVTKSLAPGLALISSQPSITNRVSTPISQAFALG